MRKKKEIVRTDKEEYWYQLNLAKAKERDDLIKRIANQRKLNEG